MCIDIFSYKLGKKAGGSGGDVNLQNNKQVSVTSNGTTTINPDTDYDGMKKVTLTTNVQPNLESKSITISTNTTTTITPTSGKDGLSSVEVTTAIPGPSGNINITNTNVTDVTNYATAQVVDANLTASNIKKDVSVLGITGSYEGSGGADLDDYFDTTITKNGASSDTYISHALKRIPQLTIASGITSGLSYAFYNVKYSSLTFDGIDCSSSSKMQYTFGYNGTLNTIDLANIVNTENIENVEGLFYNCTALERIDNMFPLTKQGTQIKDAFYNCQSLKQLDLSNWTFENYITTWSQPFANTYKLAVLDISGLEFNYISYIQNDMFTNCGRDCLQSDGAYADGIPYVYVRSTTERDKILNLSGTPSTWSTNNVVVKQS